MDVSDSLSSEVSDCSSCVFGEFSTLADFTNVSIVQVGSSGQVFKGQAENGDTNALKKMGLHGISRRALQRIMDEIVVLSRLTHPNLISYVGAFVEDHSMFLVTEYCDTGDLFVFLSKRKSPVPMKVVRHIFTQVSLGLKHLHGACVLHRDVKTKNIFLTSEGRAKLGDFGASFILDSPASMASTMIGTPFYIAPEVLNAQPYSYGADVWSLGCVLFELCTRRPPFTGDSYSELTKNITTCNRVSLKGGYLPLEELLTSILNTDPAARATIDDVLNFELLRATVGRLLTKEEYVAEMSNPSSPNSNRRTMRSPQLVQRRLISSVNAMHASIKEGEFNEVAQQLDKRRRCTSNRSVENGRRRNVRKLSEPNVGASVSQWRARREKRARSSGIYASSPGARGRGRISGHKSSPSIKPWDGMPQRAHGLAPEHKMRAVLRKLTPRSQATVSAFTSSTHSSDPSRFVTSTSQSKRSHTPTSPLRSLAVSAEESVYSELDSSVGDVISISIGGKNQKWLQQSGPRQPSGCLPPLSPATPMSSVSCTPATISPTGTPVSLSPTNTPRRGISMSPATSPRRGVTGMSPATSPRRGITGMRPPVSGVASPFASPRSSDPSSTEDTPSAPGPPPPGRGPRASPAPAALPGPARTVAQAPPRTAAPVVGADPTEDDRNARLCVVLGMAAAMGSIVVVLLLLAAL